MGRQDKPSRLLNRAGRFLLYSDRVHNDLTWQGAGRDHHPNDILGTFAGAAVVRAAGREVSIAVYLASSTNPNDTIRAGDVPGIAVT